MVDGSSQTELERRQSSASSPGGGGGGGEPWSLLTVVLMGVALTLAVITTVVGLIARMGRRPPGGRGAASATRYDRGCCYSVNVGDIGRESCAFSLAIALFDPSVQKQILRMIEIHDTSTGLSPRLTVGGSSAAAAAANAAVASNGGLGLMKLDGDCTALTTYHQHRPDGLGGGAGGGGGVTMRKNGGGDTTLINRAFQDNGFEGRGNDNGVVRSPDVIPRGYGMANEQHSGTHDRHPLNIRVKFN